ncbi:MAG: hypothetical protein HY675_22245 [Chloroflexi bacterium]|nr:hypothetical protein [Chloroflexota bacterium]
MLPAALGVHVFDILNLSRRRFASWLESPSRVVSSWTSASSILSWCHLTWSASLTAACSWWYKDHPSKPGSKEYAIATEMAYRERGILKCQRGLTHACHIAMIRQIAIQPVRWVKRILGKEAKRSHGDCE